jgi:hypothetical protein
METARVEVMAMFSEGDGNQAAAIGQLDAEISTR